MASHRAMRLAKKYKNKLLCEWCNRWAEVPNAVWSDAIRALHERGDKYIYFCDRDACVKMRIDGLLSNIPPYRRKSVIWGHTVNDPSYTHKPTYHSPKQNTEDS